MRFVWAVLVLLAAPLMGGCGLFLEVGNPEATGDPRTREAFTTVRLFNCFGESPGSSTARYPTLSTTVNGTAEGLVFGERTSVPLRIVKLAAPGVFAVHWEMPGDGVWLLNLQINDAGPYFIGGKLQEVLAALVAVRQNRAERRTHLLRSSFQPQEVDNALRRAVEEH